MNLSQATSSITSAMAYVLAAACNEPVYPRFRIDNQCYAAARFTRDFSSTNTVASPWNGDDRGALVARITYSITLFDGTELLLSPASWYSPSANLLYTLNWQEFTGPISVSPATDPTVEVLEDLGLPGGYRWISASSAVPRQDFPVPTSSLIIINMSDPPVVTWAQTFVCRFTRYIDGTSKTYLGNQDYSSENGLLGCVAFGDEADEKFVLNTMDEYDLLVSSHFIIEGVGAPAGGGRRRHLLLQEPDLSGSSSNRTQQQRSWLHSRTNVSSTTTRRLTKSETVFDVYKFEVDSVLGLLA
jgi:hypothetical protein